MRWLYVAGAVVLVVLGGLSLFSIGAPLLLTGLAMLGCYPWRDRRDVLWPSLAAVWAFIVGYLLVAPLGCTTSSIPSDHALLAEGYTRCNGVFFDYAGGSSYNAPLLP